MSSNVRIQVSISVQAPPPVIARLTSEFFWDAIIQISQGEKIPGVKVSSISWHRPRKTVKTYRGINAVQALRDAIDKLGAPVVLRSIEVSGSDKKRDRTTRKG